jgi:hypothetical protein
MNNQDYEDWLAKEQYWSAEAFEERCDARAEIADLEKKES